MQEYVEASRGVSEIVREAAAEVLAEEFRALRAALEACEPHAHIVQGDCEPGTVRLFVSGKIPLPHTTDCPGCRARELLGMPKLGAK